MDRGRNQSDKEVRALARPSGTRAQLEISFPEAIKFCQAVAGNKQDMADQAQPSMALLTITLAI
jgi:hypothetical protein